MSNSDDPRLVTELDRDHRVLVIPVKPEPEQDKETAA